MLMLTKRIECGELGHGVKRCPVAKAAAEGAGGDGGFGDGGFGDATESAEPAAPGGWGNDDSGGVAVESSGGW